MPGPTEERLDRAAKEDPCPSGIVVALGVPAPCYTLRHAALFAAQRLLRVMISAI
jgi:hypothetical protein